MCERLVGDYRAPLFTLQPRTKLRVSVGSGDARDDVGNIIRAKDDLAALGIMRGVLRDRLDTADHDGGAAHGFPGFEFRLNASLALLFELFESGL
jgi:hypothetical protein